MERMLNELKELGYYVDDFEYEKVSKEIFETLNKSDEYLNKSNECLNVAMELNKTNPTNEEILKLLSRCNTYSDLTEINNNKLRKLIDYVEKHGHRDDYCALVESEKYFGLFVYIIFDKDFNIINVVDI